MVGGIVNLVWERVADYIVENTNYQFHNKARVNGEGPVVATIGRVLFVKNFVYQVRMNGKTIAIYPITADLTLLEQLVNERFTNE
jgi:hypothetical protein